MQDEFEIFLFECAPWNVCKLLYLSRVRHKFAGCRGSASSNSSNGDHRAPGGWVENSGHERIVFRGRNSWHVRN